MTSSSRRRERRHRSGPARTGRPPLPIPPRALRATEDERRAALALAARVAGVFPTEGVPRAVLVEALTVALATAWARSGWPVAVAVAAGPERLVRAVRDAERVGLFGKEAWEGGADDEDR